MSSEPSSGCSVRSRPTSQTSTDTLTSLDTFPHTPYNPAANPVSVVAPTSFTHLYSNPATSHCSIRESSPSAGVAASTVSHHLGQSAVQCSIQLQHSQTTCLATQNQHSLGAVTCLPQSTLTDSNSCDVIRPFYVSSHQTNSLSQQSYQPSLPKKHSRHVRHVRVNNNYQSYHQPLQRQTHSLFSSSLGQDVRSIATLNRIPNKRVAFSEHNIYAPQPIQNFPIVQFPSRSREVTCLRYNNSGNFVNQPTLGFCSSSPLYPFEGSTVSQTNSAKRQSVPSVGNSHQYNKSLSSSTNSVVIEPQLNLGDLRSNLPIFDSEELGSSSDSQASRGCQTHLECFLPNNMDSENTAARESPVIQSLQGAKVSSSSCRVPVTIVTSANNTRSSLRVAASIGRVATINQGSPSTSVSLSHSQSLPCRVRHYPSGQTTRLPSNTMSSQQQQQHMASTSRRVSLRSHPSSSSATVNPAVSTEAATTTAAAATAVASSSTDLRIDSRERSESPGVHAYTTHHHHHHSKVTSTQSFSATSSSTGSQQQQIYIEDNENLPSDCDECDDCDDIGECGGECDDCSFVEHHSSEEELETFNSSWPRECNGPPEKRKWSQVARLSLTDSGKQQAFIQD